MGAATAARIGKSEECAILEYRMLNERAGGSGIRRIMRSGGDGDGYRQ